jgi:thymidylate kinase
MAADAATFFESFFRELERRGLPFVILHGYEHLPAQMPSDIDYAVRGVDLPKLLPIQREIAARLGWVLASDVRAKLFARYAVFFNAEDPVQFIQLDACGHYVERGRLVMRDEELLARPGRHRFFNIPAPAAEFGYLLAKALIKQKPMAASLAQLRRLHDADPPGTQAQFARLLGQPPGGLDDWLQRPAADWDEQLRPRIRAHTRFGLANWLREGGRAIRRIVQPAGLHVVICGPDGAGKSTIIARLGTLACFRRQRPFHFRPHVFDPSHGPAVTQPHAQLPRAAGWSNLKTLYYFADHWLGYWLKVFPAKVRNELVIFDRSFEDLLIDPRRYRLSGATTLAGLLKRLAPRADFTVVLDAEPAVIHARKPELALEELRRQREALRQLAAATPHCAVIPAAESPERVEHLVRKRLIQFLAEREEQRLPT